jgi:hypothetical protein
MGQRKVAILERIATHAPLGDTLDELVRFLEAQIPGAIGSRVDPLSSCDCHSPACDKTTFVTLQRS